MTPPALVVLCAALVCSIFGTTLEGADHASTPHSVLDSILKYHQEVHEYAMTYIQSPPIKHKKTNRLATEVDVPKKEIIITPNSYFEKTKTEEQRSYFKKTEQHRVDFSKKKGKRVKRDSADEVCDSFAMKDFKISHPHAPNQLTYYNNTDCSIAIDAEDGRVVQLTFVDVFHIEHHPECAYDYLEIRDGRYGYAPFIVRLCGETFPSAVKSTGPRIWLKFHSDDTIEYEGFHINVEYIDAPNSHDIHETCYVNMEVTEADGFSGVIDSTKIDENCKKRSEQRGALDVLWTIKVEENYKIFLNFTSYSLTKPNECEENVVQVFGAVLEYQAKLAHYCGSIANAVSTKGAGDETGVVDKGNIMHVRLFASRAAIGSAFNATFTRYRTLDPNKDNDCSASEFSCGDNTCIHIKLRCDVYAHCRLKSDEDTELCKNEEESMLTKTHILVILVIFSLILSGMSFVFLFKCIRKLYQDHKIIKEHIRQSCEDRLDNLVVGQLDRLVGLNAAALRRESEPRASLERENHANEMYKRKISQKQLSSETDIQETQIDLDEESWRREVEHSPIQEEVQIERNGRIRKDLSRRESARSRTRERSVKEKKEEKRDASVGVPDTKESGCQTRESLFQADAPSSNGSGSGSGCVGFSTFGYSGATIARPSPPQTKTSEITIELLRSMPSHDSHSSKKLPERRPMSTETTRSAPDVIIVSKPIR